MCLSIFAERSHGNTQPSLSIDSGTNRYFVNSLQYIIDFQYGCLR